MDNFSAHFQSLLRQNFNRFWFVCLFICLSNQLLAVLHRGRFFSFIFFFHFWIIAYSFVLYCGIRQYISWHTVRIGAHLQCATCGSANLRQQKCSPSSDFHIAAGIGITTYSPGGQQFLHAESRIYATSKYETTIFSNADSK